METTPISVIVMAIDTGNEQTIVTIDDLMPTIEYRIHSEVDIAIAAAEGGGGPKQVWF